MNDREFVCGDLTLALEKLQREGYRLDVMYPADNPHTAILTLDGESVRVSTNPSAEQPSDVLPPFVPESVLTRGGTPGEGRAGMLYRDLIPSRLGGRYIASHITITEGGPVADWVHFHRIALQLICVCSGWVRVVYEDQGEPFVMHSGDLVLQPPGIRHRVLESSPGLEVVEISAPALHETFADHELVLPNERIAPDREFGGQRFMRHISAQTPWTPFHGGEAQEAGVNRATCGLADVRVVRATGSTIAFPPHDGELVFGFILEGSARLDCGDGFALGPADAFVIPPSVGWDLSAASPDLRLLQVTTSRLG